MRSYGTVRICLAAMMEMKGISKKQLCQDAGIEMVLLNRICENDISRLDTRVLARLCAVLTCQIDDLLEFVPPEK